MALFSNINFSLKHAAVLARVRANKGDDWNTSADGISELREILLKLQNWRCVYCQAPIERHANGYRELDHILPKNGSKNARLPKAHSDNAADRRVTFGYQQFTFEPLNLVITCKECNNKKGTHDPLINRARARVRYPNGNNFLWFHPHYQTYDRHIQLNENFTFTGKSAGGKAVIDECGLADSEGLKRRFLSQAQSIIGRTIDDGLKESIRTLALSVVNKDFGMDQAITAILENWSLSRLEAIALVTAWKAHFENDEDANLLIRANQAVKVAAGKLGRANLKSS